VGEGVLALSWGLNLNRCHQAIGIDLQQEHIAAPTIHEVSNLLNLVTKRAVNEALLGECNAQGRGLIVALRGSLPILYQGQVINGVDDDETYL
jgi:hypothetical protein